MDDAALAGEKFAELVRILDSLRGENGCPWDKEQDVNSISDFFLEEVFEAVHAIFKQDSSSVAEELGDVLMEIVFLARIYHEQGDFHISEVLEGINHKMRRRHPHVFGRQTVKDADEVARSWNRMKELEKKEFSSIFQQKHESAPALLAAYQIGRRASRHGFDWESKPDVVKKLHEEIGELTRVMEDEPGDFLRVVDEMGDVLFSLVNICRWLNVNPEIALARTNRKFLQRFQFIESRLKQKGKELDESTLKEMDLLWDEAKSRENKKPDDCG